MTFYDEGDCQVEFIGSVNNRNIGCVGDAVIKKIQNGWLLYVITMIIITALNL